MICYHGLCYEYQSHGYDHENFNAQFDEKSSDEHEYKAICALDHWSNKAFRNPHDWYRCLPKNVQKCQTSLPAA